MTLPYATDLYTGKLGGRAGLVALRKQAQLEQAKAHAEMDDMVRRSRVRGCSLVLQQHVQTGGAWKLRWRIVEGGVWRHIVWHKAESVLADMPLAIKNHFIQLNQRAEELAVFDIILTHTIKYASIFLDGESHKVKPVRRSKKPHEISLFD